MLSPQASAGAVDCQYDGGSKTLEVFEDSPTTIVRSGSNIRVVDPPDVVTCSPGGATVINTDAIVIVDSGPSGNLTTIDFGGGPFAPGADNEGGSNDEIEFGLQGVDLVVLQGTGGVDNFRFGTDGGVPVANFNVGSETGGFLNPGVDDDATMFDTQEIVVLGGAANDVLRGDGGVGTGSAFQRRLSLFGGPGDDQLLGGDAGDRIGYAGLSSNEDGNDTIGGGAGADQLSAAPGNDQLSGGAGPDRATYFNSPSGLTIDLATAGQQDTGGGGLDSFSGVESVYGSPFDDTLLGDDASNTLTGGAGGDLLDGRAGADELVGDSPVAPFGSDTLIVRDGGPDTASCGPEPDSVSADLAGVDTIDPDCETIDFAAFPPPGGEGGGGEGSDSSVDVTLAARRKQDAVEQRGLIVRAACPEEDCDVAARGSIRVPRPPGRSARAKVRRVKLRRATAALSAGVDERLRLRLRKRGAKRVRAALDHHRSLRAVVGVTATDAAGNRDSAKVKVKVVG
ncbi:MAG TPA: calcium-binding protein [Solirubrobacterales bacterium]